MLQGVDIDLEFGFRDLCGDGPGSQFHEVGSPRQHGLVVEPDDGCFELIGDRRRTGRGGEDVAAADVDLVGQRQGDGLSCDGFREVACGGNDARNGALPAGRQHLDPVAGTDRAGRHQAREAAKVEIGPVYPLDRHAERTASQVVLDRRILEPSQQGRPGVPAKVLAGLGDVVALQRRHRDGGEAPKADLVSEGAVVGDNFVEPRLRPRDQVHLVDGQDDVADPQQVDEVAMPPRLSEHALARVDQDYGGVRRRGAGDHVARVLFVPWRVGDDELALVGGEETVGDIDGDALLALRGQAVDQQCEIYLAALGPDLLGIRLERRELILEDHL